jgi:class 3 adenylate cyclase/tetratricopeptide (TPR) repeat protein
METPGLDKERKVVTVLFADLVGFTSRAEELDPEDVEAILRPYHERLRAELERHGGTVEKFIGDAVMALFGAPIAHEDDPERAVRAALAIRDWIAEEGDLNLRIAVNTGEALVNLGARPEVGEGMASGDVVNTTARLQAAAPVNGILAGEATYRATSHVINYREGAPVEAKGKANPIPVWEAVEALSRFGVDVPHQARTTLVGRQRELAVLRDALERARRELSPQLVTVVGVPGMGKSRLVYELFQLIEADPEIINWRQGRSLPYGEGVSFWALAEMVKAQAGILETDGVSEAETKLEAMVAELMPEASDQEWILRHVRALAGAAGSDASVPREEAFAAWRHFLEALAELRPLVLVFEDLHWADDVLLEFVDHLVEWASGVPMLVVGTARPELVERRPGWGGGKPNATTLSLSPLSDDDTTRLIGALLGRAVLTVAEQTRLLLRSGGNPLYAEQYVRMIEERADDEELPLPESIQGIIAARLDALAPAEKTLLQDAAVIGKVFWPAATAALGGRGGASPLDESLHALERKQFVRRERRSSVADEIQYAFLHVLVRDVAYGQIPRATRIDKHRRAAEWIESLGRREDHAEMLAHHYLNALELLRAASQEISELAPQARVALRDAGDRARGLAAFATAARFYEEALELWPQEARTERADLLFRLGLALSSMGADEGREMLERARAELLAVGDRGRAAEADSFLAEHWWMRGERDCCFEHLERALHLARTAPPSAEKARVFSQVSKYRMLANEDPEVEAGEALELAESLGLDEIRANVLITIGTARSLAGAGGGREEVQRGLEIALAGNWLDAAIRGYTNLSFLSGGLVGELGEALRLNLEAEHVAERLGSVLRQRYARGNTIALWLEVGEWDRCLRAADEFLARSQELGPHYMDSEVHGARAYIRLARGDVEGALADQSKALARARSAKDPQTLNPALGLSAWILHATGLTREARQLAAELISAVQGPPGINNITWVAEPLGLAEPLSEALRAVDDRPWFETARRVLDGDFEQAAQLFDQMGAAKFAALARLRAAEKLVKAGRRAEADTQLQQALAFWRALGATTYIRESEALLAASA